MFSEDASQQTQPSPKTPSSTLQSQPLSGTNSETYSNSRDIGSRSSEDLATHQTPPSQQAPSSSVQGQQQLPEIDTRSVNNSEINSSSGSNNFSESLTTQETQRASQSINIVQSQLQTEVGEELPSTAGTLQNSNPGKCIIKIILCCVCLSTPYVFLHVAKGSLNSGSYMYNIKTANPL